MDYGRRPSIEDFDLVFIFLKKKLHLSDFSLFLLESIKAILNSNHPGSKFPMNSMNSLSSHKSALQLIVKNVGKTP
jgi:hypothetical protein